MQQELEEKIERKSQPIQNNTSVEPRKNAEDFRLIEEEFNEIRKKVSSSITTSSTTTSSNSKSKEETKSNNNEEFQVESQFDKDLLPTDLWNIVSSYLAPAKFPQPEKLTYAIKKQDTQSIIKYTQNESHWINLPTLEYMDWRKIKFATAAYCALNPPNAALFDRLLACGLDPEQPIIYEVENSGRLHRSHSSSLGRQYSPPTKEYNNLKPSGLMQELRHHDHSVQLKFLDILKCHYGDAFPSVVIDGQTLELWTQEFSAKNKPSQSAVSSDSSLTQSVAAESKKIFSDKLAVYNAVVIEKDYAKALELIKKNNNFLLFESGKVFESTRFQCEFPNLFTHLIADFKALANSAENTTPRVQIKKIFEIIIDRFPINKLNQLVLGKGIIHYLAEAPEFEDLLIRLCQTRHGLDLNLLDLWFEQSALCCLLRAGRVETARKLLQYGATLVDMPLRTLQYIAYCSKNNFAFFQLLIEAGAGPILREHVQLDYIWRRYDRDILTFILLVQLGANPNTLFSLLRTERWEIIGQYNYLPTRRAGMSQEQLKSSFLKEKEEKEKPLELFNVLIKNLSNAELNLFIVDKQPLYYWLILNSQEFKWTREQLEPLVQMMLKKEVNYEAFLSCAKDKGNTLICDILKANKSLTTKVEHKNVIVSSNQNAFSFSALNADPFNPAPLSTPGKK